MELHVELAAEALFHIGPIPITNSMLMMFIIMALILLVGRLIASKAQVVPGRAQGGFELVVEFLLNLVESTAGKTLGRRVFPLVSALFIFIIIANYSGLLPGVGTIGVYHESEDDHGEEVLEIEEAAAPTTYEVAALPGDVDMPAPARAAEAGEKVLVPFMRPPNADLNMTLAMALITFLTVQILGVRAHGVVGRIKHMADPPLMFPIELISEFSRIVSLSARLFGNVFAGEVLLGVMVALTNAVKIAVIPFVFPVVFLFLEMLFGFIQALVFALLTLIYITLAGASSHGHEEHSHDDEHEAHPVPAQRPAVSGAGD